MKNISLKYQKLQEAAIKQKKIIKFFNILTVLKNYL